MFGVGRGCSSFRWLLLSWFKMSSLPDLSRRRRRKLKRRRRENLRRKTKIRTVPFATRQGRQRGDSSPSFR